LGLVVYNTLTHRKEDFKPLKDKVVNMYICGVTPYDEVHLGHARCYVAFDVIRRFLEFRGYTVNHVQNFTDIDDKIIKRAAEKGVTPQALAQQNIDSYFRDIDALNVKRAKAYPRVTEHIADIIQLIDQLVKKDYAYVVEGDVYYRVAKFAAYGQLSRRDLSQLKSGARVEVDERKNDPLDFALWKKEKPGEPSWPAPWGAGRPGWHIECSAMSLKELKVATMDIHGGGQDLIFPHHENEIAQTEGATGKPFVKYWMHNGFVTINKEKMSKSLGNFFTLADIYKHYEPKAVRLFLVSQHYRNPIDYNEEKLAEARKALVKFYSVLQNIENLVERVGVEADLTKAPVMPAEAVAAEQKFISAMEDDFNTAEALAVLYELLNTINKYMEKPQPDVLAVSYLARTMIKLGQVLGLFPSTGTKVPAAEKLKGKDIKEDEIESLIALRAEHRSNKRWAESDKVRDELLSKGIVLEDTAHGTRWKVKE
jgi:cysteinyl-tRNA synthetase